MTFIIGTFQSHCKSEHNQVKWNKITRDMCRSESFFPCLQGSMPFKWLSKLISWQGLSKKWVITVLEEKCTLFNFSP